MTGQRSKIWSTWICLNLSQTTGPSSPTLFFSVFPILPPEILSARNAVAECVFCYKPCAQSRTSSQCRTWNSYRIQVNILFQIIHANIEIEYLNIWLQRHSSACTISVSASVIEEELIWEEPTSSMSYFAAIHKEASSKHLSLPPLPLEY